MLFDKKSCTDCASCPSSSVRIKRMGLSYNDSDYTIALAGNPNTGKSTIFNALTGLKQHTGNWPGKTVERAEGAFSTDNKLFKLVDLPGTYSLLSTSEDEQIARDFILFSKPDVTVVVADMTRIERNLNLILQILEISDKVVICANLADEARRNGIKVDIKALSELLGVPVIATSARSSEGVAELISSIKAVAEGKIRPKAYRVESIRADFDDKIDIIKKDIEQLRPDIDNSRWLSIRLLEKDEQVLDFIFQGHNEDCKQDLVDKADALRMDFGDNIHDQISEALYEAAARISEKVIVKKNKSGRALFDVQLDKIVTSKRWGFLIMLAMLSIVLWITIVGSNYPSDMLSEFLVSKLHPIIKGFALSIMPSYLAGMLVDGIYLTTAWVVSVMLPPMAIFFPLFTLLEDFGFLPRVAFNLDELFRRSGAHGKQALTMTMGFGCNAAAVINTRIIDSPRERLIAIITNNFSLCNGRWPTQILLATIFIAPLFPTYFQGTVSVLAVILIALLGIVFMFLSSWLLSRTILKGEASSFSLELPPYRPPQFWQTLYKSLINRTLVVLWRAVVFAAPAGLLIWLSGNINIGAQSIAQHLVSMLDYPAWFMGLNGVILLAYILAIPANEIVIPTILMLIVMTTGVNAGDGAGVMFDTANDADTLSLLHLGGWTVLTAVNLMIFSLLHNPCSTTLYNIYKETNSVKWTAVSALLPLAFGIIVTILITFVYRLFFV